MTSGTGGPEAAPAVSRSALESELAALLGARHEARFIVDEAIASSGPRSRRAQRGPSGPSGQLDDAAVVAARRMAARRLAGEPLQYVFGHWSFRTLDLRVDHDVLIPRPETEQVVEVALGEVRSRLAERAPGLIVVDAGTGSGAIALSLATELGPGGAEVWATDSSAAALRVAQDNLVALQRGRAGHVTPVRLLEGSWLEPLPERLRGAVDLVVSNPPYVSAEEWEQLDAEVRAEPRGALVAGPGSEGTPGLADVEAVLAQSLAWLASPGVVVVELAPHQAAAAARLAEMLGYDQVAVVPDLSGRSRAVLARRGPG